MRGTDSRTICFDVELARLTPDLGNPWIEDTNSTTSSDQVFLVMQFEQENYNIDCVKTQCIPFFPRWWCEVIMMKIK